MSKYKAGDRIHCPLTGCVATIQNEDKARYELMLERNKTRHWFPKVAVDLMWRPYDAKTQQEAATDQAWLDDPDQP